MQKKGKLWKSSDYAILAESNFIQSVEKRTSLGDPVPHLEGKNIYVVNEKEALKRGHSKLILKPELQKRNNAFRSPGARKPSIRDYISAMDTEPVVGRRSSSRGST